MSKISFNKIPLTIAQQLNLLIEKGLVISDHAAAEYWLSYVSYFRIKEYSHFFKEYTNGNSIYKPGTTFEMVKDLYLFDRRIKMLIFEALESIEIAVKTHLTNTMAARYGAHWYVDPRHFISEHDRSQMMRNRRAGDDIPKIFNHEVFLKNIEERMSAPVELYLQTYKNTYEPLHPPSWMMVEMITFGTLSLLYESLKPTKEKTAIHDHFGLTKKHLASWLHCFTFIRNKCAHHSRVVYTHIYFAPALPQRKSRQFLAEADEVDNTTLYAVLCCIQFMLNTCNSKSLFKQNLLSLLDAYPTIDYKRLGFTPNWRKEKLWS